MINMKKYLFTIICLAPVLATNVVAQERSAGGSQQYQASWSSLKTMIDQTNGDVSALRSDFTPVKNKVDDITSCGNVGKIYGPDYSTNKAKCVNIQELINSNILLKNIAGCNAKGLLYDQNADTCKSIAIPKIDSKTFNVEADAYKTCGYNNSNSMADKLCVDAGYEANLGWDTYTYSSEGDNCIAEWDGKKMVTTQANHDNRTVLTNYTCYRMKDK
jgi:hypothetical protein